MQQCMWQQCPSIQDLQYFFSMEQLIVDLMWCGLTTSAFNMLPVGCLDGGRAVQEWISECYKEKELVDIETYLMHAGKPWRKQSISHEKNPSTQDCSVGYSSPAGSCLVFHGKAYSY